MFNHDVFCGACDSYDMLMFFVKLRSNWLYATFNYPFIIQLDGCMYSFCCGDDFMMTMIFYVNMVNNKVVDNLLIYLVLNFHSHMSYGLRHMAIRSLLSQILTLWPDLKD